MPDDLKIKETPVLATVSRSELLTDGSDVRFRQLVHDLLAFSSRLQEIRGRFGAFVGLTGIQYTILITVRHLGGDNGVGIKSVAEHLSLSSPFVTIETKKLIAAGLLIKRADSEDRRRVRLTLSAEGEARLTRLLPMQRQVNDALFASLDAQDFERLAVMAAELKEDAGKALRLAGFLAAESADD